MDVLEMKNENNKEIFDFFKQLNINDVRKLVVIPQRTPTYYYSFFRFETENGIELRFHYKKNKKADDVCIVEDNHYLFLNSRELHKEWINHIFEQFVDHFNLRIRLMFINENMPWRWELECTK